MSRPRRHRRRTPAIAGLLAAVLLAVPAVAAEDYGQVRGFVDKEIFTRLADEDETRIEIYLPGSLLNLVCAFDEDLADLCKGLKVIQAVVLEFDDPDDTERAAQAAQKTATSLMDKGWVRLAKIKESSEEVNVLVLNDEEAIMGLTVLIVDGDEVIFANVAGMLDLQKIKELGEGLDLPGLRDIEVEE